MRVSYALPALAAAAALMLTGCVDNSTPAPGNSTGSSSASDIQIDDAAAALLPDAIAESGILVIGTSPNYPGRFWQRKISLGRRSLLAEGEVVFRHDKDFTRPSV